MVLLGEFPSTLINLEKIPELFNSICQIFFANKVATGFFLQLNIQDFPFNKCLLTNNHVLNKEETSIGKEITLKLKNNKKIITITNDRRVFTDVYLDYTCIEILPKDNIQHFFQIVSQILGNGINTLAGKDIILLSCFNEKDWVSFGKIMSINDNSFFHNCNTKVGSSGAPIINKSNLSIIGIQVGFNYSNKLNLATPINFIIDNIKKNNIINNLNIITSKSYKETFKNLVLIGKGNFGTVYKGKIEEEIKNIFDIFKKKKEEVRALKILNKEEIKKNLKNELMKDNVEEEFKLWIINSLENEIINMNLCMKDNINSIKFYELYDNEKEYALVMELCDDNLMNILNKKKLALIRMKYMIY